MERENFDPGDSTAGMQKIAASDLRPGHVIISGAQFAEVIDTKLHGPGEHPPHSPIVSHMTAREVITTHGTRWSGVENPAGEISYMGFHPMWEGQEVHPHRLRENEGLAE